MLIDTRLLIACGIGPVQARQFEESLHSAFESFGISTPTRVAAFIAQAAYESANFTRLEESLYYTSPERIREMWPLRVASMQEAAALLRRPRDLANRVYSNRLGNGDEGSGDGWQYRGRGLFQLTGRANYMAAGEGLKASYKNEPWLVSDPADAAFTAAWYWAVGGLNALADNGDIDGITRRINGPAMVGADARRSLYDRSMREIT